MMRLRIGEFAKVGFVSVSALRYYDEVGLLKPAHVDNWTGYRFYDLDQIAALNRILALKDLGLSLEQIREMMGEELPAEQIRGMLRLKRAELEAQDTEIRERLARIEARLQQIDMEGKMPEYDVILKKVEPMKVAVVHDTIPNPEQVSVTFNRLFDEVIGHVERQGGVMSGPALDLWYDGMSEDSVDMKVAAALPIGNDISESERVKVEHLPGVEQMAGTVHRGSFATVGQAYGALIQWIQENGYRIAGPSRELYLQFDRTGDPNQYITEIQFPVEKV
jgi:effector-binding domain-containing protein